MLLAFALLSANATGTVAGNGEVLGAVGYTGRVGTNNALAEPAPLPPAAAEAARGLLDWIAAQLGINAPGNGNGNGNGNGGAGFARDSSGL